MNDRIPTNPQPPVAGPVATALMGVFMLLCAAILIYLIIGIWPQYTGSGEARAIKVTTLRLFWWSLDLSSDGDLRLLLLVAVAGAIGSFIHAATSFVSYVGNRAFVASWLWWYLLRLPIGSATALLFYFLLRGGLLSAGADSGDISVFGMVAIGGLAGMFSKQASDKLREVFDNLFRVGEGYGDDQRKDKLEATAAAIDDFEPKSIASGGAATTLRIIGQRMPGGAKVLVDGKERATTVVSDTVVEVALEAADTAQPGKLAIVVVDAAGKRSNERTIEVT